MIKKLKKEIEKLKAEKISLARDCQTLLDDEKRKAQVLELREMYLEIVNANREAEIKSLQQDKIYLVKSNEKLKKRKYIS